MPNGSASLNLTSNSVVCFSVCCNVSGLLLQEYLQLAGGHLLIVVKYRALYYVYVQYLVYKAHFGSYGIANLRQFAYR